MKRIFSFVLFVSFVLLAVPVSAQFGDTPPRRSNRVLRRDVNRKPDFQKSDQEPRIQKSDREYPPAWKFPLNGKPVSQPKDHVDSLKRFSFEFYKHLTGDDTRKNENVVCSPWSLATVLAMLVEGADSKTAEEIRKVLGFQGVSADYEKYLQMVAFNTIGKPGYHNPPILETANSFWHQADKPFRTEYIDVLKNRFLADCFAVDFQSKPAENVQAINKWCADKTRNEITEIVSEGDMNIYRRMFLLNAVYFKGRWNDVFQTEQTQAEWFYHADGSKSKTRMMNKKASAAGYYEATGFKALRKVYEGNVHMLILLPEKPDGLAELEKKLSPQLLNQIDDNLQSKMVDIKLPRFTFQYGEELIPSLQKLGINDAFVEAKADFSKMTGEKPFFVDFIRQTAMIKVDEKGTVAAAVSMGGGMGGGMMEKPKTFFADHPFLFLIRENTDNSILFMGRVHHPEKADDEK